MQSRPSVRANLRRTTNEARAKLLAQNRREYQDLWKNGYDRSDC